LTTRDETKNLIHGNDERQFHAVENAAGIQHVGHERHRTTTPDCIHHVDDDRWKTCRLTSTHKTVTVTQYSTKLDGCICPIHTADAAKLSSCVA